MINFRNENWKCEKARSIIVNDEYDIINENGDLIATVYPISNNDGDTAKIARLLAAAPKMYEWLSCIIETPKVFADMPNLQCELQIDVLDKIDGTYEEVEL